MIPEIKTVVKKYFVCPKCGKHEFSYGHLSESSSFGPWYCDHCGQGWLGKVTETGVDIVEYKHSVQRILCLLKFAPELSDTSNPVHIIIPSRTACDGDLDKSYYFDEHTCPWNYLRFNIRHGADTDPHGIFEFVESVPAPDGWQDLSSEEQFGLFSYKHFAPFCNEENA